MQLDEEDVPRKCSGCLRNDSDCVCICVSSVKDFVSDIAVFVLKRDVTLQLTHSVKDWTDRFAVLAVGSGGLKEAHVKSYLRAH